MKKYSILITLISLVASASSFAATGTQLTNKNASNFGASIYGERTTPASEALIGKLSNNVSANFNSDSTSYAVNTKHKDGTKEYGSSSGDTKLFFLDYTAGQQPEAPSASDSTSYNSWSSL